MPAWHIWGMASGNQYGGSGRGGVGEDRQGTVWNKQGFMGHGENLGFCSE